MSNQQPPRGPSSSSLTVSPQQQQRRKKVEWSTTISSSEPQSNHQNSYNPHPQQHPPNLHPQPQPPPKEENKSPGWDTESDHLLSYFLSSSTGGVSSPNTEFVTTPPIGSVGGLGTGSPFAVMSSGNGGFATAVGSTSGFATAGTDHFAGGTSVKGASIGGMVSSSSGSGGLHQMPPTAMRPSTYGRTPVASGLVFGSGVGVRDSFSNGPLRRQHGSSGAMPMEEKEDEGGLVQPPPTPATQYYYPSSSSSSSRSKKKANADTHVRQRSEIHHAMNSMFPGENHNSNPSLTGMEGVSPISPAAMIGVNNHEPMVLPGQGNAVVQPQSTTTDLEARKSHMDWLKQINAMAQANVAPGAATIGPATASAPASIGIGLVPSPQNMIVPPNINETVGVAMQHSPPITTASTANSTGVPIHPAAAAALAGSNKMFFSHHAAAYLRQQAASSPVESEEKRAKRLERNRESARKSRRRKKERLSGLEAQVNGLHNRIEKERRLQINAMDATLGGVGKNILDDLMAQLSAQETNGDSAGLMLQSSVSSLLERMETPVRKDVVEFQYTTLGQNLLPRYQKLIMWLFLHQEAYFLQGKEEYAKRESMKDEATKASSSKGGKTQQKSKPQASAGKVSSKQIGDEMTNGPKNETGTKSKSKRASSTNSDNVQLQAAAEDAARMWPLTCFELSLSVDQEDKFLQARSRVQNYENFRHEGHQISAATRMTSRLKEAVQYQLFVASYRKKKTFLEILTPRQAIKYQEWLLANGDRCRTALMTDRNKVSSAPSPTEGEENVTLEMMCQNLEKVLNISQKGA